MVKISEIEGPYFKPSGRSLWRKFTSNAKEYPDNIAIACTHQPRGHLDLPNTDLDDDGYRKDPYLRISYSNFVRAVNTFANALLEQGVEPGTPIISFMPNCIEYALAIWTTAKLGCTWVPLNPRNLLNKEEVSHMVKTALSFKSSNSAVILAQDAKVAEIIDQLNLTCAARKYMITMESRSGWVNFSNIFTSAPARHPKNLSAGSSIGEPSIVLFTSGTTSLPKGVSHPFDRFSTFIEARLQGWTHLPEDVLCIVAPNNHAIGMIWFLLGHGVGSSIVFAGTGFNPQVMMDTMIRESCTHIALVPTMVHALLGVKATGGGKVSSLKSVSLGGAMVNPEIIDKCFTELGAQNVENIWGMTEGCATTSNGAPIQDMIDGDTVSVGCASPNSRARVCAPDSNVALPIGVAGELHYSSPMLTRGYIGKESDDFYVDDIDGSHWFKTGDQATIDEQGRIFITGRYKEMIIRGAENIAPAAIEAVLMKVPELMPLDVQIVGAKDSIAGEVPVAVCKGSYDAKAAQAIQQTVLSKIGPAHVPDQVIALDDLQLSDWPRTMAGKIQKNKLSAMVQTYRDKQDQPTITGNHASSEVAQTVRRIWKRALGYDADETLSFASFADSITIMRIRDMIVKETGRQLSLADMVEANNITGQIEMLKQQSAESQVRKPKRIRHSGPIVADDIVVFHQKPSTFESAKTFIESMLARQRFTWAHVADITPAYDFSTVTNQTGIMDSWSLPTAITTKSNDSVTVRKALCIALSNNPLYTSFYIWNEKAFHQDVALHVIMKQTDEYLNKCIHDFGSVKTVEDLKVLTEEYPVKDAATLPGPLFDANLVFVEETKSVAIVLVVHHAVVDASCSMLFFEDLENALQGKSIEEHIDYKVWADSYYSLRTSLDAQSAAKWHVDRLAGLSSHKNALWLNDETPRAYEKSYRSQFEVPAITKLRQTHPRITAPVILKTAFILVSAYKTKHTHALFVNQQASRDKFPFVPKALEDLGHDYSAADVAGPTIETVVNLIKVQPRETVLDFFNRVQTEQDDLTKYAGAPLQQILSQLNENDSSTFLETLRSFVFNWVPGLGSQTTGKYDNLELVHIRMTPELALNINAGLGGDKGQTMIMDFHGAAMTREQYDMLAKELEATTTWLCNKTNWSAEVGGYVQNLETRS